MNSRIIIRNYKYRGAKVACCYCGKVTVVKDDGMFVVEICCDKRRDSMAELEKKIEAGIEDRNRFFLVGINN